MRLVQAIRTTAVKPVQIVVVISSVSMIAGCSLTTPGCGDRGVRASIEQDARSSINLWLAGTSNTLSADMKIAVSGTYETARSESTRSCSATIKIGGRKDAVEVPIDYEVINTDDGNVMYRWDSAAFGKAAISTALVSILANAATPPKQTAPAGNALATAAASARMQIWKTTIHSALAARARRLTNMPSGSQTVRFRVGPDGEITGVKAMGNDKNSELAKRTVSFLETTNLVPKPPENEAVWVEVTLRF